MTDFGVVRIRRPGWTFAVLIACIHLMAGCNDRSARLARETSAIQVVKTIHQAEVQYYSQYGRYAQLKELGPPASGSPDANGAGLLPADIVSSAKNGYVFRVATQGKGYQVIANPEQPGSGRSFYSDESMTIRQSSSGEANAQSPEFGA